MIRKKDFLQKKIVIVYSVEEIEKQLTLSNENVLVLNPNTVKAEKTKFSLHNSFVFFVIGDITFTTKLIKRMKTLGVSMFFLNYNFSHKFSILSYADGNYLLKSRQYKSSELDNLEIAKKIIKNKVENQMLALKKGGVILNGNLNKIEELNNSYELLAYEGNIASKYFENIFYSLSWYRRTPRAKEDEINLLMDIGYTYLFNYIDALVSLFGFDTYVGVFHKFFYQRKSLICDLVEPFRVIIDYEIVKNFNLKAFKKEDFAHDRGVYRFKSFEVSKKYSNAFADSIRENGEEIYLYIYGYYRCFSGATNTFPYYKFNKRK